MNSLNVIQFLMAAVVTIATSKIQTNKTLKILTIENEPWMMIDPNKTGLAAYSGYMADYVRKLSDKTGFSYEFYSSGLADVIPGKHDGLLNEMVTMGADVVAAPILITPETSKAAYFIHPLQQTGITILIRRPSKTEVAAAQLAGFSVLKPFSTGLWLITIAAFLLTTLLLWICNHYNPYEYGTMAVRGRIDRREAEAFTFQGSLWFVFTTLQWQGFERSPHSIAAKILSSFWFVFVTLTLVTYIGSLVNCLSISATAPPPQRHHIINSIEDLFSQDPVLVNFGWIRDSSTDAYFKKRHGMMYHLMIAYIDKQEKNIVNSLEEGIAKVRNESYALLVEKLLVKSYINQKPCDLISVGEPLHTRGYGIAVGKNISEDILEPFHQATLEMQEQGDLDDLERIWWGDCYRENTVESPTPATWLTKGKDDSGIIPITVPMFAAPLIILLCGICITAFAFLGDVLHYKYYGRYATRGGAIGGPVDEMNDNLTEHQITEELKQY
ncbi:unnamed protein product [Owenia fusiformis]|uniref:Uncharacterized protein n=1 Tax=Owenia fusiformis TaxID=6347 RepID=A0A8J1TZU7_OWEFU|nr:unnamed protein product [Owenia fusiformis]